jgi:hypothetical protein
MADDLDDLINQLTKVDTFLHGKRTELAGAEEKKANKLTRIVRGSRDDNDYTVVEAGTNLSGDDVYFCTATYVNVAGYILTWKQTVREEKWSDRKGKFKDRVVRCTQFAATKSRKAALAIAERRATAYRARLIRKKDKKEECA